MPSRLAAERVCNCAAAAAAVAAAQPALNSAQRVFAKATADAAVAAFNLATVQGAIPGLTTSRDSAVQNLAIAAAFVVAAQLGVLAGCASAVFTLGWGCAAALAGLFAAEANAVKATLDYATAQKALTQGLQDVLTAKTANNAAQAALQAADAALNAAEAALAAAQAALAACQAKVVPCRPPSGALGRLPNEVAA
jgi:hypothetical protein